MSPPDSEALLLLLLLSAFTERVPHPLWLRFFVPVSRHWLSPYTTPSPTLLPSPPLLLTPALTLPRPTPVTLWLLVTQHLWPVCSESNWVRCGHNRGLGTWRVGMNSHWCEVEVDKEQPAAILPGDVSFVCHSLARVSKCLAPSGQTRGASVDITAALW